MTGPSSTDGSVLAEELVGSGVQAPDAGGSTAGRWSAHLRTVWPHLRPVARGRAPRRAVTLVLRDPDVGLVRLTGELREPPGARDLLLLVHGLGGSSKSPYCRAAALAAERLGLATFSLSLRGADRRGEDFYNIALTADLHAAVGCPELRRFRRIDVLGFSMGGHVSLAYACEEVDPRVQSVVALCTPLDLRREQLWFDRRCSRVYRRHVLAGLKEIYAAVAARRPVPTDPREVAAVRTVREWDRLTIAPRYGFPSPEAYYRELSVGPKLGALRLPALLVAAAEDPIVPPEAILDPLRSMSAPPRLLDLRWVRRAGHVAPGRALDLGMEAPPGLVPQVAAWMRSEGRR